MNNVSYGKTRKLLSALTVFIGIALILFFYFKTERSAVGNGDDYVCFFDVGQGDAALICSNGYSALVDTGTRDSGKELCTEISGKKIKTLDALMISHLHTDHTGSVADVLEVFGAKNLILPELSMESEGLYAAELAVNKVTALKGNVYNAVPGMNYKLGEFEITVLGSYGDMKDENDRSVVTMAKIGNIKFLFMGDAGTKTEKALLEDGINLECDVLKMGHHGSSTSSSEIFLDAARPEYAVISAGEGNSYGHPHKETIQRLNERKIKYFRTDNDGSVTFSVTDGELSFKTEK